MNVFVRPLGNAVKKARSKLGLTQNQVAEAAETNSRTVMDIENYRGNPKMKILYPLIRFLKIDPREIFYPEMQRETPMFQQLQFLIEDSSEQEAATLIPVVKSVLSALRSETGRKVE